mmetsp:Transcript_21403/g.29977  ORF Transcript_21403/g.29977 Transcript_21403/m.29977 type:complete len:211 (+) Transcript_21403:82-714(+)|eukprot:CAMPEP_0185263738 /NCGR_PEP_ID=MMETSP1359-20130426/16152_1 /TAXON_ID=552665 /ORGANISM="Bigelowiella longifila, Strain CCMP242" /LENGTH=210 /DNA_ID=CAMNT_0027851489 /DNA_START=88 /DNA_END=720 /DNA_ORIENTATION=-
MAEENQDKDLAEVTNNRVFVGNLAWEVRWQDLKDHMSEAGEVERADVLYRPDGKSKGGGLVRFKTVEAAEKAIKELNNTELMGRQIFVREDREAGKTKPKPYKKTARPAKSSDSKGEGAGGDFGSKRQGEVSVFVGNIPWHTRWQTIKDLFQKEGVSPEHVDVGEIRNGRSRGFAIMKFASKEAAEAAIEAMDGYDLEGREIQVRLDNKA